LRELPALEVISGGAFVTSVTAQGRDFKCFRRGRKTLGFVDLRSGQGGCFHLSISARRFSKRRL